MAGFVGKVKIVNAGGYQPCGHLRKVQADGGAKSIMSGPVFRKLVRNLRLMEESTLELSAIHADLWNLSQNDRMPIWAAGEIQSLADRLEKLVTK